MKTLSLSILLFLTGLIMQAQLDIDSLKGVWNDENASDTSRAYALLALCRSVYLQSQPDSCVHYAELMYEFSNKRDLNRFTVAALSTLGLSYYFRSQYEEAIKYYKKGLELNEEIKNKKGMGRMMNNLGNIYTIQSNYPRAMYYFQRSLNIKRETMDKRGEATTLGNMGTIYVYQGNYIKAIDYYQRCLHIKEDISDRAGTAVFLNNIAEIYTKIEEYPKAMEYYLKSVEISLELNDKKSTGSFMINIGSLYIKQEEYEKAYEYIMESLKISEELSNAKGIANAYNMLGELYLEKGEHNIASEYFHKSLKINEDIEDIRGQAETLNNLGKVSNLGRDYQQAINWCKKALAIAKEIKTLEIEKTSYQCLYYSYKAMEDHTEALDYHLKLKMLNDSLQAKEASRKLQQIEFAREVLADSLMREEKKLQIQIANEAEMRQKNLSRNIFILSVFLLLVGSFAIYRRIALVRKAKKAIEQEKERSENLLLNILPGNIAEELKRKGRANARKFDEVSILFTDFKQFTQISKKLGANELVKEINDCFEPFDAICKKYSIEKIKTIGDSYMAAGGLLIQSKDAVRNTVLAALEMVAFIANRKKEREAKGQVFFEMRAGIHTGSVVAGIIGVSKFQYDIWGDTVNIASRIENAGEVDKVNISRSTYELIKNDPAFKFQPRGMIKAKGKGDMEMWFVELARWG